LNELLKFVQVDYKTQWFLGVCRPGENEAAIR
jgi:hypothetical protein